MTSKTHKRAENQRARAFASAAAFLSLPVALVAVVSFANVKLPQTDTDFNAAVAVPASLPDNATREFSRHGVAEHVFQSGWGTADADAYARIAMAFDSDPLQGAELRAVACRERLCRVSFDASPELPVRKLLPVQLAQTFNSIVAVHDGDTHLVYVDIPPRN